MTLQSLLDMVVTTLRADLRSESVTVIETQEFSDDRFSIKVRAQVQEGRYFQVYIYHNRGHYDYSYQLFADRPLIRWDNKEDCPGLENYPHHRHSSDATIVASSLRGDPVADLPVVTQEVAKVIRPTPPDKVQPCRRMRK
jgi:hypothetical protein